MVRLGFLIAGGTLVLLMVLGTLSCDVANDVETVRAQEQTVRIKRALSSATGGTLDLNWLKRLDESIVDDLAGWGSSSSDWRGLHLNGVQALDAATAEKLNQWGRGEAGRRELYLAGLRRLDATTAEHLAQWGRTSPTPLAGFPQP